MRGQTGTLIPQPWSSPPPRVPSPGMATREIPTLICDVCGTDDDVKTRSVKLDRRTRFVEACDGCVDPVRRLVDAGRRGPTPPVVS